jgi:hypothetical protein
LAKHKGFLDEKFYYQERLNVEVAITYLFFFFMPSLLSVAQGSANAIVTVR